ncbi:MAG: hypothetical protein MUE72_13185 [Chitinophagaceae bacterium]|jgi:hypothetical protein|nr:hypothetical protein [Chitinophagaceae bacterium]
MTTQNKLGIWMDHSNAQLILFIAENSETVSLDLVLSLYDKTGSNGRSEHLVHNKENQEQYAYYLKLGEVIKDFDEVLLFGPTNAKVELYNILKLEQKFTKIKIELQQADKMTDNQQHAFVKNHFTKK